VGWTSPLAPQSEARVGARELHKRLHDLLLRSTGAPVTEGTNRPVHSIVVVIEYEYFTRIDILSLGRKLDEAPGPCGRLDGMPEAFGSAPVPCRWRAVS